MFVLRPENVLPSRIRPEPEIKDIVAEHWEIKQYLNSPDIEYIENFYVNKLRLGAETIESIREKVHQIGELGSTEKKHVVNHIIHLVSISAKIEHRKLPPPAKPKKLEMLKFIAVNPAVRNLQYSKYRRYEKDAKGRIHKRNLRTGRYMKLSKSEKRIIQRAKGK